MDKQLYPPLLLTNEMLQTGSADQSFRLKKISDIEMFLKNEIETRRRLEKRYAKGMNIVIGLDSTFTVLSVMSGIAGVVALGTGILAPVALATEIVAIALGGLSFISTFINKKLREKMKKHDEITMLAESKLNTINDHISIALADNAISTEEFKIILSELEKYTTMKNNIRSSALKSSVVDEKTKKELIEEGKKIGQREAARGVQGLQELLAKLASE